MLSAAVNIASDSIFFAKPYKRGTEKVDGLTISEILLQFNIPFLLHCAAGHRFARKLNFFLPCFVEKFVQMKFIFKLL